MDQYSYIQNNKKSLKLSLFIFFICYILIDKSIENSNPNIFNRKNKNKIIINDSRKKNLKICLCIMGKKENLYAKEYISHYKKLGYNHIYLYDNNDINEERFDDILQNEINEGFLSLINYRGIRGPQLEIYYNCYEKYNKLFDWLSFFDFDEFLELIPKYKNIQEFLNEKMFEKCQNIKINFLYFSDNELLYYDKKKVQERFSTPLYKHPDNKIIKSTVRGGLKDNYWKKSHCSHSSLMNFTSCNSLGKIISYKTIRNYPFNKYNAILKHYYTKSVEEYCAKIKRGEAFYANITFDYKRKINKINRYFSYNKKTLEKIKLFKKLLKLNNDKLLPKIK